MNRPSSIEYLGNQDLLNCRKWGFIASRTIPSDEVLRCYDWASERAAAGDCVVSGFQSPIERDVLHFLLKKRIPIVVVLARAIYKHIPEELREAYDNGSLLFISVNNALRTNQVAAKARNHYVAELANTIVFGMLTKESSLYEIFIRHAEDTRKLVLILKDEVKNQTAYTQQ